MHSEESLQVITKTILTPPAWGRKGHIHHASALGLTIQFLVYYRFLITDGVTFTAIMIKGLIDFQNLFKSRYKIIMPLKKKERKTSYSWLL